MIQARPLPDSVPGRGIAIASERRSGPGMQMLRDRRTRRGDEVLSSRATFELLCVFVCVLDALLSFLTLARFVHWPVSSNKIFI